MSESAFDNGVDMAPKTREQLEEDYVAEYTQYIQRGKDLHTREERTPFAITLLSRLAYDEFSDKAIHVLSDSIKKGLNTNLWLYCPREILYRLRVRLDVVERRAAESAERSRAEAEQRTVEFERIAKNHDGGEAIDGESDCE